MISPVFELVGVSKTYRSSHFFKKISTRGLDDLTLSLNTNEVLALIGLNGSGKTTTIKIMLGLITPDSGTLRLFGRSGVDNASKKNIGYLPEIPYFNLDFTPREILGFWGGLSELKGNNLKNRIAEVLEYTSIHEAADRPIRGFSRGMLQRLGICQSILADQELLILDEPMGGLDPLGVINMRELILKLKKDGKSIFFSSHIIGQVEKIADRIAIIHRGRILNISDNKTDVETEFLETIRKYDIEHK